MNGKRTALVLAILTPLALAGSALGQFGFGKKDAKEEQVKTIAHFKIAALVETPQKMPPLFGEEPPESTKGLLERLKEARTDNSVQAVILEVQSASLGLGQLAELHDAISSFKAVDKDVYVHADVLRTGSYALATSASHISITPTGDVWLLGLFGETPYLKGLLDKMGIVADFEHCGEYKTAAEILTRSGPSEASRRMTSWLLDDLYGSLVEIIVTGRGMKPAHVRKLIDEGPYTAEDALGAGLIDSVKHRQDFIADIKSRYGKSTKIVMDYGKEDAFGKEPANIFEAFSLLMEILSPSKKVYTEPSVAVVYVEGLIQTGTAQVSPFGVTSGAYSTTIRKALDKAAEDDSVKAVVLRIDSGGGSALASEIIWEAGRRVAAKKPFIASMGNIAASGGYYVACGADAIFADGTTVTSSIGVVGGKLVTTGGWNKLGIYWSANQRGKMAAMMSSAAPFNEAERAKIIELMNVVYDVFKQHVVDGRGDKLTKPIDEMAGGRVFTGSQALELGLIDKLGGFDNAVKFAAEKAGIAEYEIRIIPETPSLFDLLLRGDKGDDEYVSASLTSEPSLVDTLLLRALLPALSKVDPARASAIEWSLRCVELIHSESVATVLPFQLVIK